MDLQKNREYPCLGRFRNREQVLSRAVEYCHVRDPYQIAGREKGEAGRAQERADKAFLKDP